MQLTFSKARYLAPPKHREGLGKCQRAEVSLAPPATPIVAAVEGRTAAQHIAVFPANAMELEEVPPFKHCPVSIRPELLFCCCLRQKAREERVMRRQLLGVALVLASFCALAEAQETTTGSIIGTVSDTQGAAMPGVSITITSDHGSKRYVTDASGRFFAPYLTPGLYTARAERPGFNPVEQKNIEVHLGKRLEVPF